MVAGLVVAAARVSRRGRRHRLRRCPRQFTEQRQGVPGETPDDEAALDHFGGVGPPSDKPGSAWFLAGRACEKEMGQVIASLQGTPFWRVAKFLQDSFPDAVSRAPRQLPEVVGALELDVDSVVQRERERGLPKSVPVVRGAFVVLSWVLDRLFEGRPIQKFWALETIARVPYFAYNSALHLYESLGIWRTPRIREVHNAEEHNELHHLLIMEALGGDAALGDRLLATSAAVLYYWAVLGLFLTSPRLAYNFSVLVEEHAYVTYAEFVEQNEERLRLIPAPPVAINYYLADDMYYFDRFQTRRQDDMPPRRPPCENLLDVFSNIRDDEFEHMSTMKACEEWWAGSGPPPLPTQLSSAGTREEWREWAARVNSLNPR